MQQQLLVGDLNGIITITQAGALSQIRFGEVSTHRPFEALMNGFDLRMGIKCSQANYDKAARKQKNNRFIVNKKTLLKHIHPGMFGTSCSDHTITEVTGKKPTWKNGKRVPILLSVEEELFCNIAEWAYSCFGTLKGVSVVVSLNNGQRLTKQF